MQKQLFEVDFINNLSYVQEIFFSAFFFLEALSFLITKT